MRVQQCLQMTRKPSAHPPDFLLLSCRCNLTCKDARISQAFPAQTGFSSAFFGGLKMKPDQPVPHIKLNNLSLTAKMYSTDFTAVYHSIFILYVNAVCTVKKKQNVNILFSTEIYVEIYVLMHKGLLKASCCFVILFKV